MSDALLVLIDRLEREHVEVRQALAALGAPADAGDVEQLAARLPDFAAVLGPALDEHSQLEDETLFPALEEFLGAEMVGVFAGEHERILSLRDALYSGETGPNAAGVCLELCDLLGGHIDREDQALFPAARGALGED